MEIKSSWVLVSFLLLVFVLSYTFYNLNTFMISEKKCEPAFAMIAKCECIPDANIAKLFNVKNYINVDMAILNETENGKYGYGMGGEE